MATGIHDKLVNTFTEVFNHPSGYRCEIASISFPILSHNLGIPKRKKITETFKLNDRANHTV